MPFRFPVKFEIPKHVYVNARVIKDQFKRNQFAEHEVTRKALKYIARNTELPGNVRLEAQLQLASMPAYTSPTQIRDRCVASGNGKWVIKDFKLNRVCIIFSFIFSTCTNIFRLRLEKGLEPV